MLAPTMLCGAKTSSTSSDGLTSAAPTAPKRTMPSKAPSSPPPAPPTPAPLPSLPSLPSPSPSPPVRSPSYSSPGCACQSIILSSLRIPLSTRGTPVNAPCPIEPWTQTRVRNPFLANPSAQSRTSSRSEPTRYESISMLSSGGLTHTRIRRTHEGSATAACIALDTSA